MKFAKGATLLAALSVNVVDPSGRPYANTPVVLFSTPKIAMTNTGGIATFHDVETGQHHLEIHPQGGAVETQSIIVEPPSKVPTATTPVEVQVPIVQVIVANGLNGAAVSIGIPWPVWLMIVVLFGGNGILGVVLAIRTFRRSMQTPRFPHLSR